MKKTSTTQSARALIALLVCGAACSIVTGIPLRAGPAFLRFRIAAEHFAKDSDVRRARFLSARHRRRLLAPPDLAKGASLS